MRIAIDISQIVYGTGVSHYRRHLAEILPRIDGSNEYVLFAGAFRRKKEMLTAFPKAKVFPIPPVVADIVWNKLHILPIEKLIGEVDLIHTSDWAEPPSRFPKVTTVHDLIPLKFPRIIPKVILSAHRDRMKWVAREARRVIVPSENTKKDLVEFGFDPSIIRVIPEASNLGKVNDQDVQNVKRRYQIRNDYIISIGTKSWKNLDRIISAFHLSKSGKNLKLIVVGERKGTHFEDERGVRFLGHVPDGDLSPLLTGAKALVFASLYEGFGVPILDGFACGVPVVTSNTSSMPEVAGSAAVLVDPYNVNSIAEGIEKALSAPKTYISLGSKRVKAFSWEKTARETLNVYKEIGE